MSKISSSNGAAILGISNSNIITNLDKQDKLFFKRLLKSLLRKWRQLNG
jgi:hypothetical protein